MWDRVRAVTGQSKKISENSNFTAEQLNAHYSTISTDNNYSLPISKLTVQGPNTWISEEQVFRLLDRLKPSSRGMDNLPSWFLKLSAAYLSQTIADVYNVSLSRSEVPVQWKCSIITPVAKNTRPSCCADFRPISITPILSRLMEKIVVRNFIYPMFTNSDHSRNYYKNTLMSI